MLKDKVALITGASSGMGKDFAKALLKEGINVYTAARRLEQMEDLKQLGATTLKMDITKDDDIKTVVEIINKNHGGIDILINNAGFGLYGSIEETNITDIRYQFEVNFFGLARLTQLMLPTMRAKKAGKIINISSMAGKIYSPFGGWYHATKHAIEGWSDCLRTELQQFNIDVIIIEPGIIKTSFDTILIESMLKRSENGPYSKMANSIAASFKKSYSAQDASEPKVITDLVLKAIKSAKPKIRYAAGKFAKPMIFVRKWLGDRIFDKMISFMINSNDK